MKTKRVLRYYCEFCKKSGGVKRAMEKHEKHCTMNPDRECRMCETESIPQVPMQQLLESLGPLEQSENEWGNLVTIPGDVEGVRELTECPACILAAIRQSGQVAYMYNFDYKAECEMFWVRINREQDENAVMSEYGYG